MTEVAREALDEGKLIAVNWANVAHRAQLGGLTGDGLIESVYALAEADLLEVRLHGSHVQMCSLTPSGYDASIEQVFPGAVDAMERVIIELVNDAPAGNEAIGELSRKLDLPRLVVDRILLALQDRNLLSLSRHLGGDARIGTISPTIRRLVGH